MLRMDGLLEVHGRVVLLAVEDVLRTFTHTHTHTHTTV
jgi:hypothetical protein